MKTPGNRFEINLGNILLQQYPWKSMPDDALIAKL